MNRIERDETNAKRMNELSQMRKDNNNKGFYLAVSNLGTALIAN